MKIDAPAALIQYVAQYVEEQRLKARDSFWTDHSDFAREILIEFTIKQFGGGAIMTRKEKKAVEVLITAASEALRAGLIPPASAREVRLAAQEVFPALHGRPMNSDEALAYFNGKGYAPGDED